MVLVIGNFLRLRNLTHINSIAGEVCTPFSDLDQRYSMHAFPILGLIDEMFGIQQSSVRLPAEKFSPQQQQQQQQLQTAHTKQIVFSSSEEMYAEIRGLNFNAVGPTLSRKVHCLH